MNKQQSKSLNLLLVAIVATLALTMSACNTAEGFGRDMESAGQGLQTEANKAK